MSILLTGGAGYIGSHTCVELLNAGYDVVVVDNYVNSQPEALRRVETITGKKVTAYEADVCDKAAMDAIFSKEKIEAVIHFAGLKAVGESVAEPLMYYRNNLDSTLTLVETMVKYGCKRIVFSSSATVYGAPDFSPVPETARLGCSNPYGWTKYMIEQILRDWAAAQKDVSVVLLRYFNPVGAHKSGKIGEDPNGIPNNLMPIVLDKAAGKRDVLAVAGNDYPTPDGSCVRDYIHVVDLAKGHVAAIRKARSMNGGCPAYNLGTGKGYSVIEILDTFERVNGIDLGYTIGPRRPGDAASTYSDPSLAEKELGWKAELGIEDMCRDAWNFRKMRDAENK